jgi:phenylalanyl-tRNA synthetase alpha chain
MSDKTKAESIPTDQLISLLLTLEEDVINEIESSNESAAALRLRVFGKDSEFVKLTSHIKTIPKDEKTRCGIVLNQVKKAIENALSKNASRSEGITDSDWIDLTAPGTRPPEGHLHIVTQAIEEITQIFNKLGFTRVRHPEVDWDWYAFESLNMPQNHPARDEFETFHIRSQKTDDRKQKFQNIVLTPHTSNGQVREMEKGILPIRMINIAKCYRPNWDVSHVPMFHQFEGLYIDRNVSIGHLKGVLDYFAKSFFGEKRRTRIRPFHFQFTEPSFEVDITCGICNGTGKLPNGLTCRLCKEGWLELGGAGMVHPNVLKAGNIDASLYNGFAFGWGVERTYMMKSGTQLDDIRILYGNDVRFLEQF